MSEIISYLKTSSLHVLIQVSTVFISALTLFTLVNFTSKAVENKTISILGKRTYIFIFGWLGTASHELGHLIFCLLFRHKVKEVKLFSLNSKNEQMGFVTHSFDKNSLFQRTGNLFIGIGPILLGSTIIIILSHFLVNIPFSFFEECIDKFNRCITSSFSSQSVEDMKNVIINSCKLIKHTTPLWKLSLFIYLSLCIGSSMNLSRSDLKGIFPGIIFLLTTFTIICFCINYFYKGYELYSAPPYGWFSAFIAVLIFTTLINIMTHLFVSLTALVKKALTKLFH